jgi:cobalamin biosynthesis Mg chelatase CobN
MKSPVNFDFPAPNASSSPAPASNASTSSYAPSVPISVYRELAAELQSTKTTVDSLRSQNQQLAQQNQRLRQELQKLAQSAVQTQQVVEALPAIAIDPLTQEAILQSDSIAPKSQPEGTKSQPSRSKTAAKATSGKKGKGKRPAPAPKSPEVYVIEQDEKRPSQSDERSSDMGGLWLSIVLILIVISTFSAGFLIVRPLFNDSNQ